MLTMSASHDQRPLDPAGDGSARDPVADITAAVQRCARGDRAAIAELYDRTCGLVYGLARAGTSTDAGAEQVTTRIYARVWRDSVGFRSERTCALAWLLRIASEEIARCADPTEGAPR